MLCREHFRLKEEAAVSVSRGWFLHVQPEKQNLFHTDITRVKQSGDKRTDRQRVQINRHFRYHKKQIVCSR